MSQDTGSKIQAKSDDALTERTAGPLTRRAWLGGAAFVVGVGASCMISTQASAKTPQTLAKYQDQPKGQSKCGSCSQFQAPNACNLVEGTISENGWCQLYSPKA